MSSSAPLLPRVRSPPTVNDPGTGALNLYLFFNIFPSHFALPLLIVTLCLTRARRNVTLINLCITWIIVGLVSCILLYGGHQTGPEPPKMLCAIEASLLYAVPPMVSTSVLALVFQIWNTLVWKPQEQTQGVILSVILGLPYVVYFLFALIGSSISNATPDKVTRNRRFFYCSVQNATFSNIVALFAALLLIITTALNVWIGVTLYRNSRAVKRAQWDRGVLPGGGTKPKMNADDLQQAVRVAIFGVYIFLGLSLSLVSIVAPNSPLPDLVFASMGTAVFLVFGTQPRLWTGWRDAYRRWRKPHEPTLNPLSIPGSPSDYSDPEKQQTSVGSVGTSKFTSSRDEKPKSPEDEGTVVGSPPPSQPLKMFTPSVSDASKTFAPSPVDSNASSGLPRTAHDSIMSDPDAAVVHMAERVGLSSVDASLVGLSSIDDGLSNVEVGVSSLDAHARGRSMKRMPAGPPPPMPPPTPVRPQQQRDASPQTTAALFQTARRSRERAEAPQPWSRSRGSSPHPRARSQPRSASGDKTPPMPPPVRTDTGGLLPPAPDAAEQQSRWSPDTRSSQWSPGTRASQPVSEGAVAVENQTTSQWSPDTRSSQAVSQWSPEGAVENQTATQVTSQWSPDTTDTHGEQWVPADHPTWSAEAAEAEAVAVGKDDAKTPTGRDKPLPKLRF